MSDGLDLKLGQMVMVGFRGAEPDECREFLDSLAACPPAGVWLTDNESPMGLTHGNVRSPEQIKRLTAALQDASSTPMFIAIDGEGGQVIRLKQRYGFAAFPSARELGERDDPGFTRTEAQRLARLLRGCGINFNFAPVLDVNKNPANPIIAGKERSFSADPDAVARHAEEFIRAHHEAGILCAGKHFPGHGSSATDSHKGLVDITHTWGEDELIPYRTLIQRGLLDAVLTAHVCLRNLDQLPGVPRAACPPVSAPAGKPPVAPTNAALVGKPPVAPGDSDLPATLSRRIITGLLREQLAFDGVVFTDDLNMGAIQAHYSLEQSVELCVTAGADVVLHANVMQYDPAIAARTVAILRQLVESGKLSEKRIERSCQRLVGLKRRAGLIAD
jgi:beta-N-acetylhexosaminidase